jgi:CheY-like chemotaxis protein
MALILVVDDDETFLSFITFALKSKGHECLTADNGAEAVALYRSLASRIDVVVTDLKMPVMDGIQAILRIRMTRKDVKIICMLDHPEEEAPQGVFVLRKPFSLEEINSSVQQALQQGTFSTLETRQRRLA